MAEQDNNPMGVSEPQGMDLLDAASGGETYPYYLGEDEPGYVNPLASRPATMSNLYGPRLSAKPLSPMDRMMLGPQNPQAVTPNQQAINAAQDVSKTEDKRILREKIAARQMPQQTMTGTLNDLVMNKIQNKLQADQDEVDIIKTAIARWEGEKGKKSQIAKMDLTPLLSLADSWTGGNAVSAYKKPSSNLDYDTAILSLKEKLAKRQSDLANENAKLLLSVGRSNRSHETSYGVMSQGEKRNMSFWIPSLLSILEFSKKFPLTAEERGSIKNARLQKEAGIRVDYGALPGMDRVADELRIRANDIMSAHPNVFIDDAFRLAKEEMEDDYLSGIQRTGVQEKK